MAITASMPTILWTHMSVEESVEANGSTVAEVIDSLEAKVDDGDNVTILPAVAGGSR